MRFEHLYTPSAVRTAPSARTSRGDRDRRRRHDLLRLARLPPRVSRGPSPIVAAATHLSEDDRYRALNDSVCAIEGEVRTRPDKSGADLVVDVYELVFEPSAS